jgi:hypothetical protein
MDNFDIENVSPTKFFNLLNLSLLPTDNWKELLEVRKKDFPQYRNNRNKENLKNENEPLSDNIIYQYWLNNEIGYANSWKSNFKEKNIALIYENNIIQIDKYISYLEQERDNLLKTISKKQKTKISYIWKKNPDMELPELYSQMINEYKLIASETKYEHFKAVFTGQPIESINPIKWHQENATELLYFIERLGQSFNIDYNPKKADYQKMTSCFVKPDGIQFNASWKSLKTNLEINLSPEKQKAIDELVSNF